MGKTINVLNHDITERTVVDICSNNYIMTRVLDDLVSLFDSVYKQMLHMAFLYDVLSESYEVEKIHHVLGVDDVFREYVDESVFNKNRIMMLDTIYHYKQLQRYVQNFNALHQVHVNIGNLKPVQPCLMIMTHDVMLESSTKTRFNESLECVDMISAWNVRFTNGKHKDLYDYSIAGTLQECIENFNAREFIDKYNVNTLDIARALHEFGYYKDVYLQQYPPYVSQFKKDVSDYSEKNQNWCFRNIDVKHNDK